VFSCDIDHVTVFKEKLAGVDQALAELGTSDEEISDVRNRFADAKPVDLQAVDGELEALAEGVALEVAAVAKSSARERTPEPPAQDWDNETTDVESMDDSDFVLLVDEDDLEELERVGEEDAIRTPPPAVARESEGEEGFFKKLFGSRRTSNRP
jgi:hypothetical protein